MAKRILIVDDDRDIAVTVADVLEAAGYEISVAANGREALERLDGEAHPCLILLDLMMPVMDGWEFRRRQLQFPGLARIPVLAFTAVGDAEKQAASIRADGYLPKPLSMQLLLDTIARVCGPALAASPPA